MTNHHQYKSEETDEDLLQRLRGGDNGAFAVLWQRHRASALGAARRLSSSDAEELVDEALVKILTEIKSGRGPTDSFKAYLWKTVRNIAINTGRQSRPVVYDVDQLVHLASEADSQNKADEYAFVLQALSRMPESDRMLLIDSEVYGLKPRHLAKLYDMSANLASHRVRSAKRQFQDQYISVHLANPDNDGCAVVGSYYAAYVRGTLTVGKRRHVDNHVQGCKSCTLMLAEAREVGSTMRLIIFPLILGAPIGAEYLTWPQNSLSSALIAKPNFLSRFGVHSAVAAKGVVVAASVIASVGLGAGLVYSVSHDAPSVTSAPVLVDDPPRGAPMLSSPTPTQVEPVASTPAPTGLSLAPPTQAFLSDGSTPTTELPQEHDTSQLTRPVPAPTLRNLASPAFLVDQDTARTEYPRVAGTDAQPGATVDVLDRDLTVLGSTIADNKGAWSIEDFPAMQAGTFTLVVRQRIADNASPPSRTAVITILSPAKVTAPLPDATVNASGFTLTIDGVPGQNVQRIVDGKVRADSMPLDNTGAFTSKFTADVFGSVTLGVRYFDTATGRHGPTGSTKFTVTK